MVFSDFPLCFPRGLPKSANEITLTTIYEILKDHTARFDRVDQRFDGVDKRLTDSDRRVVSLEAKFERFETVQNSMALRLNSVEATVKEHSALLQTMQFRLDSLHGLTEKLELRAGRIEQEYVMITEALRRLEQRFDRIEANRLQERLTALEARVQALETAQA